MRSLRSFSSWQTPSHPLAHDPRLHSQRRPPEANSCQTRAVHETQTEEPVGGCDIAHRRSSVGIRRGLGPIGLGR